MTETELRAMDAEVARKVMGFLFVNGTEDLDGVPSRYSLLFRPTRAEDWKEHFPDCVISGEPWAAVTPAEVPRYSTDIAAAWEVVEKCDHQVIKREPEFKDAGEWNVSLTFGKKRGHGYGSTAPLAIVRAALKAVSEGGQTR